MSDCDHKEAPLYEFKKLLNSNNRNSVYLATAKNSQAEVVIKINVKPASSQDPKEHQEHVKDGELTAIEKEFSLMSLLHHKHILRALNIGKMLVNNKNMYQYIVYEHISNGCLIDFLQKKSLAHPELTNFEVLGCLETVILERVCRTFFLQILSAVKYCFEQKTCHRDIKLDNILVDSHFNMFLSDFDLSKSFYDTKERREIKFNDVAGSSKYIAPEIWSIMDKSINEYDGRKADIFSLGIVLFAVLGGKMPFYTSKSDDEYYQHFYKDRSLFWNKHNMDEELSCDFKKLFEGIVEPNPDFRFTIEEIESHKWCKGPVLRYEDLKKIF